MRTIVNLTKAQVEGLARLGDTQQTSRAALVRAAVDEYLQRHAANSWDEAFGLWTDKPVDALAYQRKLRAEWE